MLVWEHFFRTLFSVGKALWEGGVGVAARSDSASLGSFVTS